ncbi:hypoxanthine phosphoribosyltransferase [Desulfohalobiaceae bacterium Ax17]|jgi:hypoxanthine phosphoribosyltransferase|uniref:hypoxanthine phosphoribosyltransferase n=1 Tax=Desulfovulcanus ferrireducens TaxID=2831190 RepID=UPI00207BC349|nr:hypoxanthine phosphoribosyltransferase [Desulfovulcanus ferrireducens]MBT8762437.1 hypoxanthine phosphoribosyltransferase [Desulfovulcanus ferrireducens]
MQFKVVYSQRDIQARVQELGAQISKDYANEPLVAVCVLKGAFVFFADLMRALTIDPEMDFVRLSSYADQTSTTGKVVFSKDMEISVENKNVLVVEDIVDSGHSINYLTKVLEARKPKSIKICALLDKRERREVDVQVDYPGFVLEKGFVVGYGLDYAEKYRNKDGIYELVF